MTSGTSSGQLADGAWGIGAEPRRGVGRAVLGNIAYILRQLGGVVAFIVVVWLAVMLFRHVQAVAIALAGLVLVIGGAALFVRNRSLSAGHN